MAAPGRKYQFTLPGLNGCCRLSKKTIARTQGNERDAPKVDNRVTPRISARCSDEGK